MIFLEQKFDVTLIKTLAEEDAERKAERNSPIGALRPGFFCRATRHENVMAINAIHEAGKFVFVRVPRRPGYVPDSDDDFHAGLTYKKGY